VTASLTLHIHLLLKGAYWTSGFYDAVQEKYFWINGDEVAAEFYEINEPDDYMSEEGQDKVWNQDFILFIPI